ncbi:MAG: chemotaxis protein CheD [archaeon]
MNQTNVMMGEVKIGFDDDKLISLGLGSCIGLAMYEPGKKIAAFGHIVLPDSSMNRISDNLKVGLASVYHNKQIQEMLEKNGVTVTNVSSFDKDTPEGDLLLIDYDLFLSKNIQNMLFLLCPNFNKEIYTNAENPRVKDLIFQPYTENRLVLFVKANLQNVLKYADYMIPYMIEKLEMMGLSRSKLVAKMSGGAALFGGDTIHIGNQNIEATKDILSKHNIPLLKDEVGGSVGRSLTFDVSSQKLNIRSTKGIMEI